MRNGHCNARMFRMINNGIEVPSGLCRGHKLIHAYIVAYVLTLRKAMFNVCVDENPRCEIYNTFFSLPPASSIHENDRPPRRCCSRERRMSQRIFLEGSDGSGYGLPLSCV